MSQIKLLLDIIADVRHLGDSLEAYADALTATDKPDASDFGEIYTPPAEEEPETKKEPPAKAVSLAEVRAVLAEKSRAGFTDEVKQLLMKYGAEKLSGIEKSAYAALMKEAESLGS